MSQHFKAETCASSAESDANTSDHLDAWLFLTFSPASET